MQSLLQPSRQSVKLSAPLSALLTRFRRAGFAKSAAENEDRAADSRIQKLLKLLEPEKQKPLNLAPEDEKEWRQRAKEHSKRKMRAHREWQKELTGRLQLKNAALAALPVELREAALVQTDALFPMDRKVWTDTPPQIEEQKRQAEEAKKKGQRRLGTK